VLSRSSSPVRSLPLRALVRVQSAGADRSPEAGMATAEYAVATVAACGFSGVLYKIITSPQVLDIVKGVIGRAFKLAF
jgi:hypothetical protein